MKQQLKRLPLLLLGNALLAFAICAFVVPHDFMLGGTNGIALFIHALTNWPLWALNAILNVVLFFAGLICMGKAFAATSLISTLIYPAIMFLFEQLPIGTWFAAEDPLLCAVFAALCAGLGIGIVVRSGGSTGGMDIPPIILNKYTHIPVGTWMMIFDTIIVVAQVCIKGLDGLLLSLLIILLISLVVNRTIITGEKKVQIIIISPAYEEIRQEILRTQDCGATMLDIETGMTQESQKAVFSVVYNKKYPEIRDAVLKIDPKAFIVASEVKNVNGIGYTLARHTPEKK